MTTAGSRQRRKLGLTLVALAMAAAAAARAGFPAVPAKPIPAAAPGAPNIIMVLTDDQDVQLGSVNYMPNVKRLLAQQGVAFSNFLVPLSLCCPSRTTILRGQYPHNTQVLTNGLPTGGFEKVFADNLESATLATLLQGAGYRTVMLGKYLNGYPNTAGPSYVPPGWNEWYSPSAGNPYSEYNYTLNENGTQVVYHATPADYLTDVIRGKAVGFIQRASATPSQPLFIYFATYAPHAPYTPAPRHASLFSNLQAPRPPSFNEPDVSGKPAYIMAKPRLTQAQIDSIDNDYRNRLRALQAVDEAVAALVATLAATGRLANTYIFFTSDNGYHMGEHRLLPGKYTPYETDIHVPLIVRGPGVPAGIVRDQFAANLDLAETFADLAGVPQLPFSDGRSLKGLISATPPTAWRRAFLLEEFNQGEIEPVDNSGDPASKIGILEPPDPADLAAQAAKAVQIPSYFGFKAPDYKYVEYLSLSGQIAETELYLSSDTYELNNLASQLDPTFAEQLDAYTQTLHNCQGDGCRAAEAAAPPPLPSSLAPSDTTLRVDDQAGDRRFAVQVSYHTAQGGGRSGSGHAIPLSPVGIARGGAIWFFSPDNPEMLVKLLDACDANGQKWFFASAGTNVGFTATVTDTLTGSQKSYSNLDLTPAVPIQDTSFEACASTASGLTGVPRQVKRAVQPGWLPSFGTSAAVNASVPCAAGPTTLCIDGAPGDQRFKVEVSYQTSQGGGLSGKGQAIPLAPVGITHGGAFWFFSPDNPEMLVKVIDGCGTNAEKWVFASAGTNVGLIVTVTDTATGVQRTYQNADLHPAQPIQDTSAFATCP